jgi:hypothetical protein
VDLGASQTELTEAPRGRPVMAQRLRWRVGLALRGSFCRPRRAAARSSLFFGRWRRLQFCVFRSELGNQLSRLSSLDQDCLATNPQF